MMKDGESTIVLGSSMRLSLAAIVIMGLPAVGAAQAPVSTAGSLPRLPPIGLPLPPIGLPLPAIGLPPPNETQADTRQATDNRLPRVGVAESFRSGQNVIFFVPAWGWGSPYPGMISQPPPSVQNDSRVDRKPELLSGILRLEVQPENVLQIFVDGYYVGTPQDFNRELELEIGRHTIEIRAPGHETLTFGVMISSDRPTTYRGALKRVDAKPETKPSARREAATPDVTPRAPAPRRSTFYYIPGCYLGDVDPKDVALPANCDLSRLVTRQP
jgi:hypothetical protein